MVYQAARTTRSKTQYKTVDTPFGARKDQKSIQFRERHGKGL